MKNGAPPGGGPARGEKDDLAARRTTVQVSSRKQVRQHCDEKRHGEVTFNPAKRNRKEREKGGNERKNPKGKGEKGEKLYEAVGPA
jgi:hypothetical protein